jgi:hypothetical protein
MKSLNSMIRRKLKEHFECYALFLTMTLGLWAAFPQQVRNVQLNNQAVILPWFATGPPGVYIFAADVVGRRAVLSVRAADCVEQLDIDGRAEWKTNCLKRISCVYDEIPLPPLSRAAPNRVTFYVRAHGQKASFDIKEAHGFTTKRVALIAILGMAPFVLTFFLDLAPWLGWPLALGILIATQYLDVTTPSVRQHDVEGHREYVDHLLKTGTLPAVLQGWETFQPPFYYLVAAGWRKVFPGSKGRDPFATVQALSLCLYTFTIGLALVGGHMIGLNKVELFSALVFLALLPGHLFFAARINNDCLLPVTGTAITICVWRYAKSGNRRLLVPLALLLVASLATKTSSVAIVGGALLAIYAADVIRELAWHQALAGSYLTALPSLLWFSFWGLRCKAQTGVFLYTNASLLPMNKQIVIPMFKWFFSFALQPYFAGHWHYDPDISSSYPTAVLTSVLYGEYDLSEFGLRWTILYRSGCLGLFIALVAGFLIRPRAEVRIAWATCLALVLPQLALIVSYAVQYPFTCDQDIRFAAQAFFPLACLWGFGIEHIWRFGRLSMGLIALFAGGFAVGLIELYRRLLF